MFVFLLLGCLEFIYPMKLDSRFLLYMYSFLLPLILHIQSNKLLLTCCGCSAGYRSPQLLGLMLGISVFRRLTTLVSREQSCRGRRDAHPRAAFLKHSPLTCVCRRTHGGKENLGSFHPHMSWFLNFKVNCWFEETSVADVSSVQISASDMRFKSTKELLRKRDGTYSLF